MRPITRLQWATLALVATVSAACERGLPAVSSPRYEETVAAFYRGVAAAQAGESSLAEASFQRVTELAPNEPAGWANLGLVALSRRDLARAAQLLTESRALAPDNGGIHFLAALTAREQGDVELATALLRQTVQMDSANLKARYLLARTVVDADPSVREEARRLIEEILAAHPDNLVALLERARLAARGGQLEILRNSLDRVRARAASLGITVTHELTAVLDAAAAGDADRAATNLAFLQTALQVHPAYQSDQDAVVVTPGRMELLLTAFVALPSPTATSAPPDTNVTFAVEPLAVRAAASRGTPPAGPGRAIHWVVGTWLSEEVPLGLVATDGDTLWISTDVDRSRAFAFPGGSTTMPLSTASVAWIDYDYDFRADVAVAGPGGLRLFRQVELGDFTDVGAGVIPRTHFSRSYSGVWAADLDMEGDVDLVLAPTDGGSVALRNRGDGRFEPYAEFPAVDRLREFVWADLDADGDPDAAMVDANGVLQVFLNERERASQFRPHPVPAGLAGVRALAVTDWDYDAMLDLLILLSDGSLIQLSMNDGLWDREVIAQWDALTGGDVLTTRLFIADLDNNGDLDLVASAGQASTAWLRTNTGLRSLAQFDFPITAIVDVNRDGRLDLVGIGADGQPVLLDNRGTADNYSASLRPRAAQTTGDRRINSFGIGGEIEVRAGLLYQKQLITGPSVHFGLGDQPQINVARIIWPNGTVQAEFNLLASNEAILTRQRLKGSCPWVFAYNGERMEFVTDFIWRSALGLRINAQGDAAVMHGEDWIKIRGDQLVAQDGFYDVRITAELWETHFFDHVSLMVVDHPAGTEVFVDERFTLPAPKQTVHVTGPVKPVASARDHLGRDVTALIRGRDNEYLDTFELGPYQGIADEHFVEVSLGEEALRDGPLWLVASGWVYPTDASINVAASQGSQSPPRGIQLEIRNAAGEWKVVQSDLGFPAGKTKTILIDLSDLFTDGTSPVLRLRTNMEIYWDQIAWAVGVPDARLSTQTLLPDSANLRYRGFSETIIASRSTPETPVYDRIVTTTQIWRDLVGFHTRFGDVRVLNEAVDDRYTIMNAGDELLLRFPAPEEPPQGWLRDFVLIGDGWVKDGDYNTGFSTTVLPLPFHGMSDYTTAPVTLQDDPAYQRHPEDWMHFHTRYVTPRDFQRALVFDGTR